MKEGLANHFSKPETAPWSWEALREGKHRDYDRDYDTLAELMEFESIWLAPPGTLP